MNDLKSVYVFHENKRTHTKALLRIFNTNVASTCRTCLGKPALGKETVNA